MKPPRKTASRRKTTKRRPTGSRPDRTAKTDATQPTRQAPTNNTRSEASKKTSKKTGRKTGRKTRKPGGKKATGKRSRPERTTPNTRRKTGRGKTAEARRAAGAPAAERVQKVLSRAGLGSRRALEERIAAGEIRVNGRAARPGLQVGVGDRVRLDGKAFEVVAERARHATLIYHKPEGEVTTRSDPGGRRTVFDRLPRAEGGRWIAVGRLDLNTAGLLLLTTDGELANRMMHPSGRVDREYVCRVHGRVDDASLEKLLAGVELEDGPARFSDLVIGEQTSSHTWYTVTLMEGRKREVRRLFEAVGARVARLKRVRFGPVFLPADLAAGEYRRLTRTDHRVLREDVGLPAAATELSLQPVGR
jgi:23S rRNA pseudouridine2605 synthase